MSRAFVKERDADFLEELPDRPISEHPNDVTAAGLAQIGRALAAANEADMAAQGADDRTALVRAGRERRYGAARREVPVDKSEVR